MRGERGQEGAKALKADVGFAARIVRWQRRHGRHNLPWQGTRDPYRIWVSEVMLQQTQVATVIPYYHRFIERFPDLHSLAGARLDDVLQQWSGLGYYSRGRNLHRAANQIMAYHGGCFPRDHELMLSLPGIGRTTAAAIGVFAFSERQAILDGNVKRVLARYLGINGDLRSPARESSLWRKAEALLPRRNLATYTQGLMDLGATLCVRGNPHCGGCPLRSGCSAFASGRQHALPAGRRRPALPRRRTEMLILLHRSAVMLEKRPSAGVWGGMWSLPEAAPGADARTLCATAYGARVEPLEALPAFVHSFTHFTLEIRPRCFHVTSRRGRAPGQIWLPVRKAMEAAIPAPVRRILRLL